MQVEQAGRDPAMDEQALRARRILWSMLSYAASSALYLLCAWLGFLTWPGYLGALVLSVTACVTFLLLVYSGINLRFSDPSMTLAQMIAALVPWAWVLHEITEPGVRPLALMLSIVTMLYGMFALNTRRLLVLAALTVLVYVGVITAVAWQRPDQVDPIIEGLWTLALTGVLLQLSWIGGHVSQLRMSLRVRNRDLQLLATRDPLTELPNRRHLLAVATAEIARARSLDPERHTLTLCLIDLDHFKRVNDTLGHATGDDLLKRVSARMRAVLRENDCIGRFGGEEFLVILPDTDHAGGLAMAERLRAAVAEVRYPGLPSGWQITATIGIAEHRLEDSLEITLAKADEALYAGKHQGRNRVGPLTRAAASA